MRQHSLMTGLAALTAAALATVPTPGAPPGLDPARPVRELQLAAAPDGSLVLAVIADVGTVSSGRGTFTARELTAWRQAGGTWQALGGVLNYDRPRPISNLNLAMDERGAPILVWNENYGDNDVVVFRAFLNGNWTDWRTRYLGDDLPYAARTRAVAARRGEPVLAWGESLRRPYGSRLTVRTWDEQAKVWTRSEPFNDIRAFSRTPALALDRAGQPVVAWLQGDVLSSNVYVKRGTGEGWEALGGALNRHPNTYVASTRLVLDAQERPIVAWLEDVSGQDGLFASRWDGQTWVPLGGRIGAGSASAPSLAVDPQGRPVVAWVEERGGMGHVNLARWDNQVWQDLGPVNLDPRRDARSPSVAVDASGAVVLAWREDVGGVYRVQVRRFAP
ncbi:hypothetical protein [Deinococcus metallilatus]|uniref:Exo-alpha-sialidase n=2 Tax=Deinococcus metallilatus TaxID=1211322 RepID=A0ABR6MT70_9DEIO|nr:hypothetical protein [Deinococcus metallilatus]MBB5294162.1 hypothetical protein [Deinococcus metallilatus]GMA16501.1 hypothetical protein GCM10025871_28320 [Deinococcus metallilatus]